MCRRVKQIGPLPFLAVVLYRLKALYGINLKTFLFSSRLNCRLKIDAFYLFIYFLPESVAYYGIQCICIRHGRSTYRKYTINAIESRFIFDRIKCDASQHYRSYYSFNGINNVCAVFQKIKAKCCRSIQRMSNYSGPDAWPALNRNGIQFDGKMSTFS